MTKITTYLNKNRKNRGDKMPLCFRISHKQKSYYIQCGIELTEEQFNHIFIKKNNDEKSIEFREHCSKEQARLERIVLKNLPFDVNKIRKLFSNSSEGIELNISNLTLNDLFREMIENRDGKYSLNTVAHIRTTMNVLETFNPGTKVTDINTSFINKFKAHNMQKGNSIATYQSYLRDLRTTWNYFQEEAKTIPRNIESPFAKGKISIGNYFASKAVLSNDEIKTVAACTEFVSKKEEYARDIWLFLYRLNGSDLIDGIKLKWKNRDGDYFVFTRTKTERTRVNNIKQVVVYIDPKMNSLLDKIGDTNSEYVLGKLSGDPKESTIRNKVKKTSKLLNDELKTLATRLNLSSPLTLHSARVSLATTLKRENIPISDISDILNHSNSLVTEHYLEGKNLEKTKTITKHFL